MQLKAQSDNPNDVDPFGQGIIGRFGVGFYSSFMVSDKVDVRSKSAGKVSGNDTEIAKSDEDPIVWESLGTGTYTLSPLPDNIRQDRGTSVVLHLKPELSQYSNESTIEKILKKSLSVSNEGVVLMLLNSNSNLQDNLYMVYSLGEISEILYRSGYKFAIDNTDFSNIFKLIVLNNKF